MNRYQFYVTVTVEEDNHKRLAIMEVYDAEDSDPVKIPIAEESIPYYAGMDLGTLAWRAWETLAIPPRSTPEVDDLMREIEESSGG